MYTALVDGNDTINDTLGSLDELDVLFFADLEEDDVELFDDGDDAIITIGSTGETITMLGWGVEKVAFANGVTWDMV
ncbi:calcium-binding protein [Rhizobium etli]|uniref:calcium-binding protein n=1 Tax=Rhizobium etli TaxID=29449 RepID=UPI0012DB48CF|nr:calcium-binding protein [Rhizobium etli]